MNVAIAVGVALVIAIAFEALVYGLIVYMTRREGSMKRAPLGARDRG